MQQPSNPSSSAHDLRFWFLNIRVKFSQVQLYNRNRHKAGFQFDMQCEYRHMVHVLGFMTNDPEREIWCTCNELNDNIKYLQRSLSIASDHIEISFNRAYSIHKKELGNYNILWWAAIVFYIQYVRTHYIMCKCVLLQCDCYNRGHLYKESQTTLQNENKLRISTSVVWAQSVLVQYNVST